MCRSENSSVSMYDPGQQFYRHPPHFQNTRLYTFRQNYQKMSCIVCIILNSLQHYEVRILFSFDVISPVSVTIIRIMIRYQHSLITFFLQNANIFFNFDFSIQRSLFCMAMHIKFHKKLLPETLFVLKNHIHRTLVFQLLACLRRA